MDSENEINEHISLDGMPGSTSPASAPSPSPDCPSAVTEDADLDSLIRTGDAVDEGKSPDIGRESPSIKLSQELGSSGEEEEDSRGERVAEPHTNPRVIAVSPQPGVSPDIKSDYDSGVKVDDEDARQTPEKPSLVSTEAESSPARASPANSDRIVSAKAPPKKPTSQPPRFKNDVEPMEYQRQAAPVGYNRAVHSVQCKAMLIIMTTSILAVILIVGFIILNGGKKDELPNTTKTSLEGLFNITNRLYVASYADNGSFEYTQLSEEFISTMNATLQSSEKFYDLLETTTVHGIESFNSSDSGILRPQLDFKINLVFPTSNLIGQANMTTQSPEVTGSPVVSGQPSPGNDPTGINDVIEYLVNVTASGDFGNFTGEMQLQEV